MNLADQLHELRVNILRDDSDIIAGARDSLWSDETLLRYIQDAERRFARRTLLLRDSTTAEIVQLRLRNGVKTYPVHRSILGVISARYDTKESDLLRSGHAMVVPAPLPEFIPFNPNADYTLPPGDPIAYYTDESLVFDREARVTMTIYPAPGPDQDGKIVYMRVVRTPTSRYTRDELERPSEIPLDYQLDVLEWAAYRAQRTFDADAGAPTSADQHKKAFDDAVDAAIVEAKRKMFTNIGYRYGRNGFSWTR
jgi:hypothetical protein